MEISPAKSISKDNEDQENGVVVIEDDSPGPSLSAEPRKKEAPKSETEIAPQPPPQAATATDELNEREEGEIIDEYEDIISSDEELNLRQRIEELEARNLELEKIAAISSMKSNDYAAYDDYSNKGLGGSGNNKTTYIDLVDDDDNSFDAFNDRYLISASSPMSKTYRMASPSISSNKKRCSNRRDRLKAPKHDRRKKYRKHRTIKSEISSSSSSKRRKNVRQLDDRSSEDDEFTLDREKLKAALKRDTRSPIGRGTSLKKKLQGVKETVSAFIDHRIKNEKDEFNNEILELLEDLTNDRPSFNQPEVEMISDLENDTISLEEQELRLIALKSAIVRKHEARKRKKLNDLKPYSPTDNEIIEVISRCPSAQGQCKDELDNMEISPINSPASFDKSLLPVDMELVSSDSSHEPVFLNDDTKSRPVEFQSPNDDTKWHPIEKMPLSLGNFETDQISNFEIFKPIFVTTDQDQQQQLVTIPAVNMNEEKPDDQNEKSIVAKMKKETDALLDEEEEENALRALLLAKLNSQKSRNKKPTSIVPSTTEILPETLENHQTKLNADVLDPNIEADEIRKVLLSSMNMKDSFSRVKQKENREINLPKIALNLKDAVKRIKSKYMATPLSHRSKKRLSSTNSNLIVIDLNKNIRTNNNQEKCEKISMDQDVTEIPVKKEKMDIPKDEPKPSVPEKPQKIVSRPESKPEIVKQPTVVIPEQPLKQPTKLSKTKSVAVTNKLKKSNASTTVAGLSPKIAKPIPLSLAAFTTVFKRAGNSIESKIPTKRQKIEFNNPILMKPVNKLVIQLRPSDSETDDFYTSDDNDNAEPETIKIHETDRIIDNASPLSIAMDSPSYAPCSPVQNSTSNDAVSEAVGSTDFQKKLDEFLKSARSKVEQNTTTPKENNNSQLETAVVTPATPLSVRHLPASAQMEYRKLVNRMSILEKQKNLKLKALATKKSALQRLQPLSVTIENNKIPSNDVKITISNVGRLVQTGSGGSSLIKHVLVKNVSIKAMQDIDSSNDRIPNSTDQCDLSKALVNANSTSNKKTIVTDELNKIIVKLDNNVAETISTIETKPTVNSLKIVDASPVPKDAAKPLGNSLKVADAKPQPSKVKTVPITNTSPKKLSISHLKSMSDEEKLQTLQTMEKDYTLHSSTFLLDLDKIHNLLCTAQVAKQKQVNMESELDQLRLKMQQIETEITSQKNIISKLYPTISTSHKRILNDRTKSTQFSNQCDKLGKLVNGDEYKIPNDVKDLISVKLKNIYTETKKLKSIKKLPVDQQTNQIQKDCIKEEGISSTSLNTQTIITNPSNEDNIQDQALEKDVKVTSPHRTDAQTQCEIMEPIVEKIDKHTQYEIIESATSTVDSFGKIGKYQSPLDHMQNESSNNPNAIVCPFQLMGQCEDKECGYMHLPS